MDAIMRLACALTVLLQVSVTAAWPRSLNVTRYFHTTDKGQLHYVIGGSALSKGVPLVLLHSDPRSSAEFKYLMATFEDPPPFVAVDFYGMGYSEECRCEDEEFVKFTYYAAAVNDILLKHGVDKFVPFGCLKGTNSALALADIAGADRVKHIIQISPLMLPPSAIDYMKNVFIPKIMHPAINQNGSHLLDVWKDPSAAAFGPDGKPSDVTEDLIENEEKTIDFLRCRNNGGRVRNQKAWVDYNEQIPEAAHRVSRYAHFLIIYGQHILDNYVKYGMHPEFSKSKISEALEGGLSYENVTIADANEGLLLANRTIIADKVEKFLQSNHAQIV